MFLHPKGVYFKAVTLGRRPDVVGTDAPWEKAERGRTLVSRTLTIKGAV